MSLCRTTAFAPVPAILGGSCPLGCSLNAPATGGCSVFSLQCSLYAAGSEKEKRAGGPLHGDIIAHLFVFCKGVLAGPSLGGGCCCGLRRPSAEGLAWPVPSFSGGIGLACAVLQRRDWLGLRRPSAEGLAWPAPSFSGGIGLACAFVPPAHPPTFLETGGLPLYPRRGRSPLRPPWRDEQGTVVPPSPPSDAFGNRGTHHTPAEATPPAPCWGDGGGPLAPFERAGVERWWCYNDRNDHGRRSQRRRQSLPDSVRTTMLASGRNAFHGPRLPRPWDAAADSNAESDLRQTRPDAEVVRLALPGRRSVQLRALARLILSVDPAGAGVKPERPPLGLRRLAVFLREERQELLGKAGHVPGLNPNVTFALELHHQPLSPGNQ